MIAEIHGKMSDSNVDRNQRLEDELTGNVFGTLRYMPYSKGFKKIFECVQSEDSYLKNDLSNIDADDFKTIFWKRDKDGEIDFQLFSKSLNVCIGVEVKYKSGESGSHQLSRYAKMLRKNYGSDTKCFLVFLAKGYSARSKYYEYLADKCAMKEIERANVHFGYLSWENIYDIFSKINSYTEFEQLMIDDLKSFLIYRELDGFRNFSIEMLINEHVFYKFDDPLWQYFTVNINKEEKYEFK